MADETKQSTAAPTDTKAGAASGSTAKKEMLIEVSCPSGPRRRAGREFGPTPVIIPAADLSKAEVEAIQADAMLVVRQAKPAKE